MVKLVPLGANKHPEIIAAGLQEGKVNYFVGSQENWRTNIPTYSAVVYKEVWPGIDIKFYGNNRQLEYDIIVKPGADPSKVRFAYEGIENLKVTKKGNLKIMLNGGKIVQKKPYVYQEINGRRVEVEGCFVIQEARCATQIPPPDPFQRGTDIYPPLAGVEGVEGTGIRASLSTSQGKQGTRVRPAAHSHAERGKEAQTVGTMRATEKWIRTAYKTQNRKSQIVNRKPVVSEAEPFIYSFHIASYDKHHPLVIDPSLAYSTYLGGSGEDTGWGIAVDSSGYAYITGVTLSSNFPMASAYDGTLGGIEDAVVTKLGTSGASLVYSTYVGGSDMDFATGIAVDNSGYAYITGFTSSGNFPTASAWQGTYGGGTRDGFVTKLGTSGSSLVFSTYLGGSGSDYGYGIAVDNSGYAYVTGTTNSSNFGTQSAGQGTLGGSYDAFITKLGTSGANLVYSTYLGGSGSDYGYGIAVDGSGYAYITGETYSTNFGTASAYQGTK